MKILSLLLAAALSLAAQNKKFVVADQDASGPGGSDMAALLVFLQSPDVHLLGITVVTGDAWRNEELQHTLRLLELVGRTDVKVYPGADLPLLRTRKQTELLNNLYGKFVWNGAWDSNGHASDVIPPLPEGAPTTQPAAEDAAHFMVRMVRQYPHQVTIYGAGPMTNIALAVRLDPQFAQLAKELVIMGGSLNPLTDDPEFSNAPRHEFNFWFDPEAASITLTAPWAKITDTTVDASLKTVPTEAMYAAWSKLNTPVARYMTRYVTRPLSSYMWDELAAAAWLNPSIVKKERLLYMDVDTVVGPDYGNTLTWDDSDKPALPVRQVHALIDVDPALLIDQLTTLWSHPAPGATNALMTPAP